jgi:hypothetical protein
MPWLLSPTNAIDDLKIGLYVEPEQPICTVALVIRTFNHPLSEAGIAALRRITNIMQNDQVLRKACSQQEIAQLSSRIVNERTQLVVSIHGTTPDGTSNPRRPAWEIKRRT